MSASTPLPLSVVIPTHDTRELTLACLASLFESPVAGMEVIVVDDASWDGLAEAVRERFPEAKVQLGPAGDLSIFCAMPSGSTTDVIIDLVGYFQ